MAMVLPVEGEDAPVVVDNPNGAGPFVLVCDHASNRMPPVFGGLGLSDADREAHIAWDPGALGVSQELSRLLDAPGSSLRRQHPRQPPVPFPQSSRRSSKRSFRFA
mgnify:CR=1 FL=1